MKKIFRFLIILSLLFIVSCNSKDNNSAENIYQTRYIDDISNLDLKTTIGSRNTGVNNLFTVNEVKFEDNKLFDKIVDLNNKNLIAFNPEENIFYYTDENDNYNSITIEQNENSNIIKLDNYDTLEKTHIVKNELHCIFTKDNTVYKVILYIDREPDNFKIGKFSNISVSKDENGFLLNISKDNSIDNNINLVENSLSLVNYKFFDLVDNYNNKLILSKGVTYEDELIDAYYINNANLLGDTLSFQLSNNSSTNFNSFLLDLTNNNYYAYFNKTKFLLGDIDDFIISLEGIDGNMSLKYTDLLNDDAYIIPGYELIERIDDYVIFNENIIYLKNEKFYDILNLEENTVYRNYSINNSNIVYNDEKDIYINYDNSLYKLDLNEM